MLPQPFNFPQSVRPARGQTTILVDLPHDLLCETTKQLVLDDAAQVILAVPETWRGKIAKASIERDIRTYNTWLLSEGLEPRGLADDGRILTRITVQQLDLSDMSTAQKFARELGNDTDLIDALVMNDSDDAVGESGVSPSFLDEEKRSLIRNGHSDLEKGFNAEGRSHVMAELVNSLAPRLQEAASRSGQPSHVSLVYSQSSRRVNALDWLNSSIPWNYRSSAFQSHARHQRQQRRLDTVLGHLASGAASSIGNVKLPASLASWPQKDVLAGLHFSSINVSCSGPQQFLPSASHNQAAADQIRSVISKNMPMARA
ncbi:hypothetical protein K431DRAFT_285043 [Polychaeton citri CBS 116435]|uniref:Uncharacterized protein n=1 Tax=Polychaeton citri CBS 116435 TaxID=1314669 RepID=A0A9P4UPV8_9PEZI|nr:hypothetical protein K431DRAFT_285043 [Polychaeton citri CBS 116435]